MTTKAHRTHLDDIAADTTAPEALRADLRHALAAYDYLTNLRRLASTEAREAARTINEQLTDEPQALLAAALNGHSPTLDEILQGHTAHTAHHQITLDRERVLNVAVQRATNHAERGALNNHAVPILNWIATARAATPWTQALTPHQIAAWDTISARFRWHLPMLAKAHRFHRLAVTIEPRNQTGTAEAMRRTWHAIHAGQIERLGDGHLIEYRVLDYWPDLAEEQP